MYNVRHETYKFDRKQIKIMRSEDNAKIYCIIYFNENFYIKNYLIDAGKEIQRLLIYIHIYHQECRRSIIEFFAS